MPIARFKRTVFTAFYLLASVNNLGAFAESWPTQPYIWDYPKSERNNLENLPDGSDARIAKRVPIYSGQEFAVPVFGGLFFTQRSALDRFRQTGVLTEKSNFLEPFHFLRADENIGVHSDGGRAFDEKLGHGFIVMPTHSSDFPTGWYARLSSTRVRKLPFTRKAGKLQPLLDLPSSSGLDKF